MTLAAVWLSVLLLQEPPSMEALLRDFSSDDSGLRERAFRSTLARAAEWSAADLALLRSAAGAGDVERASRAKEALSRIEIRRKLPPGLLARLKDLDLLVLRGEANPCVQALYEVSRGVDDGTLSLADLDALAALLEARDVDLRKEIFALTYTHPHPPYARFLRSMLKQDPGVDNDVPAALMRLARLGGPAELPLILPFLKSPIIPVRVCAVSAFVEFRDRAFLEPILPLIRDPDPDVRTAVLETLAALPARDCGALAAAALSDEAPEVRHAAALALGKMGAHRDAAKLLPLLREERVGLRVAALDAMHALDAGEIEAILPLLSDSDFSVQCSAQLVLMRLDSQEAGRRARPQLGALPEVRSGPWRGFMSPDARPNTPMVVPYLRHEDPLLRKWALRAFKFMEVDEQADTIVALLMDSPGEVAEYAAEALGALAVHLPKDRIRPEWIERIRALEKAMPKDSVALSIVLVQLGAKSRAEQIDLTQRLWDQQSHETSGYHDELFRALGEANQAATSGILARRWTLRKAVESRSDLEALFKERGLVLRGAKGSEIQGRSVAGRETSLRDLLKRHFDEWTPIPEKDGVRLLRWDEAFRTWLKR